MFCDPARWCLSLALFCSLAGSLAAEERKPFEYLYVEANEGTSSGGHTAIRFDDRTYHFENREGLLVLSRENSQDFLFQYALLGNRPVHVSRIEVEEASRARLRARFNARHHIQQRQLDVQAGLRDDKMLVVRWLRRATAPDADADESALRIPAAGYFLPPSPSGAPIDARDGAGTGVQSHLRDRVAAHYGDRFLEGRRAKLRDQLAALMLEDPTAWRIELPTHALDESPFVIPYARRYRALVAGLVALDVLEYARPLRTESYAAPTGDEYRLAKSEYLGLRALSRRLNAELLTLVDSPRLDWGTAFLTGMARLATLDLALRSGRLVFLDTYPDDAQSMDILAIERNRNRLPAMLLEASAQLRVARRELVSAAKSPEGPGEREWTRVEEAANRHRELSRTVSAGSPLRVTHDHLTPERAARIADPFLPRASAEELRGILARALEREQRYSSRLAELYRYHLITNNCVSEIFETIESALPVGDAEKTFVATEDWRHFLDFIPFVSATSVNARFPVTERHVIPSFRNALIGEMLQNESRAVVALRESNTLTSQSYQRGRRDSFFLFFTDRTPLLRPLFGAANLLAATGESLFGLLRLPRDGGETLSTGLEGVAMSLPELAFANIRKGTNDWVAPKQRQTDRPGYER